MAETFDYEGWIPIATVVGLSAEITGIVLIDPTTGAPTPDAPVIEIGQQVSMLVSVENTSPFTLRLELSVIFKAPNGAQTSSEVETRVVNPNGTFAKAFLFAPTELGEYTGFVTLQGERA